MDKINYIHNLPLNRWNEYKDLYITAVKSEPIAFSETDKEILLKKDGEWKEELQEALDEKSIIIFAEQNGRLIGMYSASFHKREKLKHNAFLSSLFVLKEYRGKGIGKIIVENILKLILKNSNIKNIHCEIIETQIASIELHKMFGFKITGEIKNLFFINDKYLSEYWLEKNI